jgi:hypothetical protein
MVINIECFKKSVMSDVYVTLSIIAILLVITVTLVLMGVVTVVGIPMISSWIDSVKPFIKSVFTAYGLCIGSYLCIIIFQLYILHELDETEINKYTTLIIASILTFFTMLFYSMYYTMSTVPVCNPDTSLASICRIVAEAPYPSVNIETAIVCVWLWISTSLIIAYRRCKE